jgi:hypothetical protein
MKISVLVIVLLFSPIVNAQRFEPIVGLFRDSFSGTSARVGFAYTYTESLDRYFYSDVEYGSEAYRFSVGYGAFNSAASARIGLSLARRDGEEFIGVEGVGSIWLLAVKAGLYQNLNTESQQLSIGAGIGL